ncbi:MAG: transposase [Sandaracinaceae bacterium]|jgi:REP element-mobilizing transposase RayT|nr:transposase [Sandaracinaceae bacterium]
MSKPRYHPRSVRLWKLGSKCVDDQFLLAPTPEVRALVMLFLAKMQELYDVKIVCVVFMGNHFHILVWLREDRLPDIMRDFKGGLAKAINAVLGRRGAFWMERYDDDAVLDDAAAEAAIHYFHANPVRAHVVERADDYVGVSSWKAYAEDLDALTHTFFDEPSWRRAGAPESLRGLYTRTVTVRITRPPSWEGISRSERRAKVRAMRANMRDEERQAAAERARNGTTVGAPEDVAKREPRSRPLRPKPKRVKRKRASGSDEQVRRFHEAYRQMMPAYRAASLRFRETGSLPPFPEGTYPPRLMYAFVES